jgi:hypothetical protein
MKVLALAFSSVLAAGADPTVKGTWEIKSDVIGNPGEVCTLTQDGKKITGSRTSEGGKARDGKGEFDGGKVTFKHSSEYQGQPLTLVYTGKLELAAALGGGLPVLPFEVTLP